MLTLITDWATILVRWFHVVAGIAWIGTSFFFVWLDLSLRKREGQATGVAGEAWLVHGGGFYLMEKYSVAPERMPPELHWFKWEAYATWISGAALLIGLYYLSAEVYLVDPAVADITPMTGIVIGVGALVFGWIIYDLLCRSLQGHDDWLAIGGGLLLAAVVVGFTQVFSGRGAFIHAGALVGTMMAANVLLVIIPNQRKVVADLIAGRPPDPMLGKIAKQRSLHNNYLTLPVLFTMISNHFPVMTGHPYNWAMLIGIGVTGGLIRHWFNVKHATGRRLDWLWAAAAGLVVAMVAFSAWRPDRVDLSGEPVATLAEAQQIVLQRCTVCHAASPSFPGFAEAPLGMMLETPEQLIAARDTVYTQIQTRVMPPGNLTEMTDVERATLMRWIEAGSDE